MSTPDVMEVIRNPGFLVSDPTNLALAFPYGGTALGLSKNVRWVPNAQYTDITAEEFAGRTTERLYQGESAILMAVLRGYDKDAVGKMFPSTTTGATTRKVVHYGATDSSGFRAGRSLADKTIKLLFAPRDTGKAPALILYRALPLLDVSAQIDLAMGREFGTGVAFAVTFDSAGRGYKVGMLSDLVGLLA